jgi:drug/metabolite transporter (DMT)-like permease
MILYIKIVNVDNDNFLFHKFLFFISIFVFNVILFIIHNMKQKCKISMKNVIKNSIYIAIVGIVGYSIYNDFKFMSSTSNYFENLTYSPLTNNIIISSIIVLVISFSKFFEMIFTNNTIIYEDNCSLKE